MVTCFKHLNERHSVMLGKHWNPLSVGTRPLRPISRWKISPCSRHSHISSSRLERGTYGRLHGAVGLLNLIQVVVGKRMHFSVGLPLFWQRHRPTSGNSKCHDTKHKDWKVWFNVRFYWLNVRRGHRKYLEYGKTVWRPGLCPWPHWELYSAPYRD